MRRHDAYPPPILLRGKFALMTRLARMVVSGLPHHVTQRGNRRESIFFEDGDQEIYRDLPGKQTEEEQTKSSPQTDLLSPIRLLFARPRTLDLQC